MVHRGVTQPTDADLRQLSCQSVIWRVAVFPEWINSTLGKLTPRAFRRQGPKRDLSAEEGISVIPEGTCSPDEAMKNANGGIGIGTLLVGHVTDLGLRVERDRIDHALILEMPLKGDPGNEDDARGMHLRAELSRKSRLLDW